MLDPHLLLIVSEMMRVVRRVIGLHSEKIAFENAQQEKQVRHNLFQSICTLTKVRGHKVVSMYNCELIKINLILKLNYSLMKLLIWNLCLQFIRQF